MKGKRNGMYSQMNDEENQQLKCKSGNTTISFGLELTVGIT